MTTEPKNVRLTRLRAALARTESKLRLATQNRKWQEAEELAGNAAEFDRQIRAIEAEPAITNVVGRPRVRG
jgi:hypothetical protein